MALIAVQSASTTGAALTWTAANAGGDEFVNAGQGTVLLVRNAHASETRTLTFATPATVEGLAIADRTLAVTAAEDFRFIKFTPASLYNDGDGHVNITYSSEADVSLAVIAA